MRRRYGVDGTGDTMTRWIRKAAKPRVVQTASITTADHLAIMTMHELYEDVAPCYLRLYFIGVVSWVSFFMHI